MCNISPICGYAITACGYPDNFIDTRHTAPCLWLAVQSTGDFAVLPRIGLFLTLDLRWQTIFVITRTDFDHAVAQQVDPRFIKSIGRRKPAAVGQNIETPETAIGYVQKPFRPDVVVSAVAAAIAGNNPPPGLHKLN